MKSLLQRVEDGLYYQGRGTWTQHAEQALMFSQTAQAIERSVRDRLRSVRLVLRFEDSAYDLRLPCQEAGRRPARIQKARATGKRRAAHPDAAGQ